MKYVVSWCPWCGEEPCQCEMVEMGMNDKIKFSEIENKVVHTFGVTISIEERDALCKAVRAAKWFMKDYGYDPYTGQDTVPEGNALKEALSAFDWVDR